jgi:hypothetical protein
LLQIRSENGAKQRRFHCKENAAKKKNLRRYIGSLGDERPSYSTDKNLVARFRTGHLSTEDEKHSGRPSQVKISENVDAIHSMMLDDRRISPKNTLAIRIPSRVRYIIQVILDMRKLSVK